MTDQKVFSIRLPDPGLVFASIALCIAALAATHMGTAALGHFTGITEGFGLIPLFDFDAEQNIPTFFSVLLILACAVCALFARPIDKSRLPSWLPLFVSAGLFLIALDEFASVHERVGGSLALFVETSGIFHHAWLVVYLIILAVLAPIGIKWLMSFDRQFQVRVVAAAGLFLFGAVGLEMASGLIVTADLEHGAESALGFLAMTAEELLEMTGMSLFLLTLYSNILNRA